MTALAVAAVLVASSVTAGAQADPEPTPAPAPAPSTTVWLCKPGVAPNPCEADTATTVVRPDGTERVEPAPRPGERPIDCFYVYPTVSTQPTENADLTIEPAEIAVAETQASQFSSVCRVYAPMYRQLTLATIRTGGLGSPKAVALAYLDVRAAWLDYLEHDNDGRGVVLLGHSQGSGMLQALLRREIEPDPAQLDRIVSALLIGYNLVVPKGKDVGGSLQEVPACRSRTQTGCVVAYSSYDSPPPAGSRFGRVDAASTTAVDADPATLEVLCVNPAKPSARVNGPAVPLRPLFPTAVLGPATDVTTPWVAFPRLYSAACTQADGATWLQIDAAPQTATDARPRVEAPLGPSWGLHRADVNLALGDLVALVRSQARVFTKS